MDKEIYLKNKKLKIIFAIISLIFLFIGITPFLFLCLYKFNIYCLIIFIISVLGTTIFYILCYIKSKNYQIKYIFLGKNFKTQITKSLEHFKGASKEFTKKYIKNKKYIYKVTGSIYDDVDNQEKNDISLKNFDIEKYKYFLNLLLNCIKNNGGFVEFCKKINDIDFESGYGILEYSQIELASPELRYLFCDIYILTDFYIDKYDNSSDILDKINKEYSPLLKNFETEITQIIENLNQK